MRTAALSVALALAALLALQAEAQGAGSCIYPAVGDNCTCATTNWTTADNVPTAAELVATVSAFLAADTPTLSDECKQVAVTNLPICLSQLAIKDGCCDSACAQALAGDVACLKPFVQTICATPDAIAFGKPIFNLAKRCVYGREVSCEAFGLAPPTAKPYPPPRGSRRHPPPHGHRKPPPHGHHHHRPPPNKQVAFIYKDW